MRDRDDEPEEVCCSICGEPITDEDLERRGAVGGTEPGKVAHLDCGSESPWHGRD